MVESKVSDRLFSRRYNELLGDVAAIMICPVGLKVIPPNFVGGFVRGIITFTVILACGVVGSGAIILNNAIFEALEGSISRLPRPSHVTSPEPWVRNKAATSFPD